MVILIGSLVLLISAPLAWVGFVASGETTRAAERVESVGERPEAQATSEVRASTESDELDVAGADVVRIGTPVEPAVRIEPLAPVRIDIESIAIEAPVDAVGVYDDGSVEIPDDVARVGWYRFGSDPAQGRGSTVIVGHRDGFDQGPGAFYSIAALTVGDPVSLELSDGSIREYQVVAREAIEKEILPTSTLFAEDGPEVLTLISCIGYFDRGGDGYRENIVVTAVPVSAVPVGEEVRS
jgi:LPXTG-site transpeptidase (sortase) family protein